MEQKTNVLADPDKMDLFITREFDLPVELLYRAFTESELVAQWMGTKVLTLQSKPHGSYRFETSDAKGNVVMKASGVIHDCVTNQKIIRTFEMENAPFGVQLETLTFDETSESSSKLTMHTVFQSTAQRDQLLKLPFAFGINMAHNRLQTIIGDLK